MWNQILSTGTTGVISPLNTSLPDHGKPQLSIASSFTTTGRNRLINVEGDDVEWNNVEVGVEVGSADGLFTPRMQMADCWVGGGALAAAPATTAQHDTQTYLHSSYILKEVQYQYRK